MSDRAPRSRPRTIGGPTALLPPLVLLLATCLVYFNSLRGTFVLDDENNILNEKSIRQLWPPTDKLFSGRRVVTKVTFALNFALDNPGGVTPGRPMRFNPVGYHAFNIAVHALAGLTLYGIVRRTLRRPFWRGRFDGSARWLAFAVALLWLVHPLQTQSVTYIVQRSESLMGLFYLLTIYAALRAAEADEDDRPRGAATWQAAAVAACVLGTGCKEIMVTAPLAALLFDRTFLAGSFFEALRRRWPMYLGLAATWALFWSLGAADLLAPSDPGYLSAGVALMERRPPLTYARTQPGIILHYLRLAAWPHPLVLDYFWPMAERARDYVGPSLAILALLGATAWAFWRKPWLGFLGAWFFLILGPTSSFVPIADAAVEHRMYLPLASVVILAVFGGWWVIGELSRKRNGWPRWRIGALALVVVAGALGAATIWRNRDYASILTMWADVVEKRPGNPRGQRNLAYALSSVGRLREASEHLTKSLAYQPRDPEGQKGLGMMYLDMGDNERALPQLRTAEAMLPEDPQLQVYLGRAWGTRGRDAEAEACFRRALALRPKQPQVLAEAHHRLGLVVANRGDLDAAEKELREAIRVYPTWPPPHEALADVLLRRRRDGEGIAELAQAVRLSPRDPGLRNKLGRELARMKQFQAAELELREALRLDRSNAQTYGNLGDLALARGRFDEGVQYHRRAVELDPKSPEAARRLAQALTLKPDASPGEADEAVRAAQAANSATGGGLVTYLETLARAYAMGARWKEAAQVAQAAATAAERARQPEVAKRLRSIADAYAAGRAATQPG